MAGTSDIVDWVPIAREFYVDAAEPVFAQVGTRVFIPDVPAKTKYDPLTAKGIVISPITGTARGENKVDMPFQAKCYCGSSNFDDGMAVAKAFVNQSKNGHGTNVASGRVVGVQIETWGQQIREPDTTPPLKYILVFGRIQVGEIAT